MSKKISVLSAIHMLSKAWNNVSENCIKSCFLKCKFGVCVTSDVVLQPEDDLPVAPEGMNEEDFCRYAELDNDVAVFEDNDDEEQISNGEVNAGENDEADDSENAKNVPTSLEVRSACDTIQRFLESKSNSDFTYFYKLESHITELLCREKKQQKISDYMYVSSKRKVD
ncbi:hypothetical protein QE152_g13574 [Popillia japonica]|uniref:DDE-1 domain-containing protein n=1 Tax=Popillia japonica TaxID=7064 RepID=A0AAW1LED1_POPJA